MDNKRRTERTYGYLWTREKMLPPKRWHFNTMEEVISEPIVRGLKGIDVGSGCGYDTYIMAKNNPFVKIVSMDISEGVYKTKELVFALGNVHIIRCSALDISIKDNVFDFAYSFGVLHHTNVPKRGLLEISRILKKDSPAFIYLYEDHSENFIKYISVKIVNKLRNITVKVSPTVIYILSWIASPFIFIIFSFPSKILMKFKTTQHFAKKMPFNFGTGFFSLHGDLFDRFSAPIEHRFSRQEVYDMFIKCGFYNVNITRLKNSAGWVAWGYKK